MRDCRKARSTVRCGLAGGLAIALAAGLAPLGRVVFAQPETGVGDRAGYSRDAAGTRFSPLTEIDRANVDRLGPAWTLPLAADTGNNPQVTPIVVAGMMYLPAAGQEVLALDAAILGAATGEYKWHFETVHHALWDADMPNPPALVDIEVDGVAAVDPATRAFRSRRSADSSRCGDDR